MQVALDAANEAFNASAGRLRKLYAAKLAMLNAGLPDADSGNEPRTTAVQMSARWRNLQAIAYKR